MDRHYVSPQAYSSEKAVGNVHPRAGYIRLPIAGELTNATYKYLRSTSSAHVKEICMPLQKIGVVFFLYVKRFSDGSYIHLTNHAEWHDYFYSNHHYLKSDFEDGKQSYAAGYYLWSGLKCQEIFAQLRNYFHIDHGITIIRDCGDCQEFYHFGAARENMGIINFYLNNINLLQKFVSYFKDKTSHILQHGIPCHIVFPERDKHETVSIHNEELEQQFRQETAISKYYLTEKVSGNYLTKREIECLRWYIEGKTASEISIILGISKRTVETHLDNIRYKTNCFNKAQLSSKFNTDILADIASQNMPVNQDQSQNS